MDLLQAVAESRRTGRAFRPVAMAGHNWGWRVSPDGATVQMGPTITGKWHAAMTFLVNEISGEWEMVDL